VLNIDHEAMRRYEYRVNCYVKRKRIINMIIAIAIMVFVIGIMFISIMGVIIRAVLR